MKTKCFVLLTAPFLFLMTTGCDQRSDAEKAADEIGDAIEEAADEVGDAVENAQ